MGRERSQAAAGLAPGRVPAQPKDARYKRPMRRLLVVVLLAACGNTGAPLQNGVALADAFGGLRFTEPLLVLQEPGPKTRRTSASSSTSSSASIPRRPGAPG